ncbi:MAG: tetratricopeptide repeat protein [Bacteroidota bacterium]
MNLAKLVLILVSCGCCLSANYAQQRQIDSLKTVLSDNPSDTSRLLTLLELSGTLFRSQPDEAIGYAQQAKELAEELNDIERLAYALKNIGLSYYIKGDYVEVLNYWQQSLTTFQSIRHQLGISNLMSNIGAVYFNQGDDPTALEYYLESLKAAEKLGNKLRIATALSNIGAVYVNKEATYDKAMEYYQRAMPIGEELGSPSVIGTAAVNLGELHLHRKEYDTALAYLEKAISSFEKTGGDIATAKYFVGKSPRAA